MLINNTDLGAFVSHFSLAVTPMLEKEVKGILQIALQFSYSLRNVGSAPSLCPQLVFPSVSFDMKSLQNAMLLLLVPF